MKTRVPISLALVLSFILAVPVFSSPSRLLSFSIGRENQSKRNDFFYCYEPVYVQASFGNLNGGTHRASVVWRDPKDGVHSSESYGFSGSSQRVRFWLRIKPSGDGAVIVEPHMGMEAFIGSWTVEIFLDGALQARRTFTVGC